MNLGQAEAKIVGEEDQLILASPLTYKYYWDVCSQHLLKGEEFWGQFMTLNDIEQAIIEQRMQLWIAGDDGGPYMTMLTEVNLYPSTRTLRLLYVGGENMRRVFPFLQFIELWAHRQGCQMVEVLGRPQWLAILERFGYEFTSVLVGKDISQLKEH